MSNIIGGWDYQDMPACNLPQEVATIFNKVFSGFAGVEYIPVLYVGSQIVSGTNYCIICRTKTITPDPIIGCKAIFIYVDLHGNAHIIRIEDIIY